MTDDDATIKLAKNIGATSPYALATAKLNKKINWSRVANPRKLLEDTLGMPYEKLFDPKHNSPLYANKAGKGSQKIDVGGNVVWVDPGAFFDVTGCDVTDPIQGALADCYFISALSSIAWARPYVIAERMFRDIDMIEFFQAGKSVKINISQLLPLSTPGNLYIYCRSSNTGEIWPALYEKAYAKWRTNDPGDKPNYAPIAFGDPVGALAQLTGFVPYYQATSGISPSAAKHLTQWLPGLTVRRLRRMSITTMPTWLRIMLIRFSAGNSITIKNILSCAIHGEHTKPL
jgi:hypothetical protein